MINNFIKTLNLKNILLILGVALTYFLFGKLSFFITIDPGNVSPIWPPAGIALLAVLLTGNKTLLGIFLGSFITNFTFYIQNPNKFSIIFSILISSIIAIGAVLQAYAGKVLYNKFINSKHVIDKIHDVVKFVLIVAPVSAIVNSAISVATIFFSSLISTDQIFSTWATWWSGDFAGIVLFALFGIIVKPQTNQNEKVSFGISPKVLFAYAISVIVTIAGSYIAIISIQNHNKILIGISRWGNSPEYDKNITGFKFILTQNGFIEGKNVEYIIKNPETNKDKQREIIKDLINAKVKLIYTLTTPGTIIAKEITSQMSKPTPVVFTIVTYPVETKVINSIQNSGNNLVGTRNYIPLLRQWTVFKSLYPNIKKIGFVHRKNEPNSSFQLNEMKEIAKNENIELVEIAEDNVEQLKTNINNYKGKIDAIYSACDTMIQTGGEDITNQFAKENKIPDFACLKSGVIKGALLANTTDFGQIGKTSGELAVEILKNNKQPTELKTLSPENDTIVLNIKRAEELSIKISDEFLQKVAEIIR